MARFNNSLSYITGAHILKVGVQYGRGSYTVAQTVNQGMHLRFRNGVADSGTSGTRRPMRIRT